MTKNEPSQDSIFDLPQGYGNNEDFLKQQYLNYLFSEPEAIKTWTDNPELENYLRYRGRTPYGV